MNVIRDWRLDYSDWVLTSAGWLPAWRVIELLQLRWFEMFKNEVNQEDIWK